MVPIKAVALSLLTPAGAIVTGALMQQALIWVWPGVQFHTIFNVSLDTWLGVAAIGGLTFCAGLWIRRSAPGRAMIIPALVSPIIWLLLCQFAVYAPAASLSAAWVLYTVGTVAPLIGIGLAYVLPSNNRWRGP